MSELIATAGTGELIPIKRDTIKGEPTQTVDARELHKFLEVGTEFKDWISRRISEFELEEGKDFCSNMSESKGGRPSKEYHLVLDTAKELSMIERNEKGKEARKYFIECEKRLKQIVHLSLPTHVEALRGWTDALEVVEIQKKSLELAAPKVAFADAVNDSSNSMDLGTFAKILGTGRTRLFEWLREQGYLMATGTKPFQKYIDNGYFVVIETTFTKGDTTQSYGKTQVCGKGQIAIEKKFRET